jgi:hypothetical protein
MGRRSILANAALVAVNALLAAARSLSRNSTSGGHLTVSGRAYKRAAVLAEKRE